MDRLPGIKAPNLPVAPTTYVQSFFNIFADVLRLYFNRIDGAVNKLIGTNGGRYIQSPHISASYNADQYATADNTPTLVLWDTLESGSGFTLNPSGTATALHAGVYKIDYSLELSNTNNTAHDVWVWLEVNGVILDRSNSKYTIQARKSAGAPTCIVAYSSITFAINAGDEIGLFWVTDKAYDPVGPVDGMYMLYHAAYTTPFVAPAVPSAIGSIVFVSALTT